MAAPAGAGELFRAALPTAERYAVLLATEGVTRGLLGPREGPVLWERHLLPSAALGELIPEGSSVVDVGSGAGLPGLALALARDDLQVTLLEPLLRRTTFLQEVVVELGLSGRVSVLRGRAEEQKRQWDVVTARAVAPLGRLVTMTAPLVATGGALLAVRGERALEELVAAAGVLRLSGLVAEVVSVGAAVGGAGATVVRAVRG